MADVGCTAVPAYGVGSIQTTGMAIDHRKRGRLASGSDISVGLQRLGGGFELNQTTRRFPIRPSCEIKKSSLAEVRVRGLRSLGGRLSDRDGSTTRKAAKWRPGVNASDFHPLNSRRCARFPDHGPRSKAGKICTRPPMPIRGGYQR